MEKGRSVLMEESTGKGLNSRAVNYIIIIAVMVGVMVYSFIKGGSDTSLSIQDDYITIGGLQDMSVTVEYADVESMELLGQLPELTQVDTAVKGKLVCGTCSSSQWGEFQAFLNTKIPSCILLCTPEVTVCFNVESQDTTEQLYDVLRENVEAARAGK